MGHSLKLYSVYHIKGTLNFSRAHYDILSTDRAKMFKVNNA